jgi:peptidoglycan/xylan/chitin deacetylase (PgdA/CDA1 family)
VLARHILVFLLAAGVCAASAEKPQVALTFDDLPWNGSQPTSAEMRARTAHLLDVLQAHHAPAAGFVNCDRADDARDLLQLWRDAGAELGNHTARHRDLNRAISRSDLNLWLNDVRRCDTFLREFVGRPEKYLRFPMLHEGATETQFRSAASLLSELGLRNAQVTIDNSDFLLAGPYAEAVRNGESEWSKVLAEAFVEHDMAAARHFREVARRKLGADVPHVLLLHMNRMTADNLDALLSAFEREGFEFVTLSTALAHPAYQRREIYRGPKGLSFLYRIAPINRADDAWDSAQESNLQQLIRRRAAKP